MNLSRILLILALVLINKAFTKNVGPNIAPLELNEDIRNDLDQKEFNEYPTDRSSCSKWQVLCKAKEYARWYVDDKLAPIWKQITDFVDDKLKPIWKKTTDFVDDKLKPIWETVKDTVRNLVTEMGNKAKNLLSSTLKRLVMPIMNWDSFI